MFSDYVFVCVADTWFSGYIPGGAMPLGPKGILAIKRTHVPKWLPKIFQQNEIFAENIDDPEVQDILNLIRDDKAMIIPAEQTFFMHIGSKVTDTILPNLCHTDDEKEENDNFEEISKKPRTDNTQNI